MKVFNLWSVAIKNAFGYEINAAFTLSFDSVQSGRKTEE